MKVMLGLKRFKRGGCDGIVGIVTLLRLETADSVNNIIATLSQEGQPVEIYSYNLAACEKAWSIVELYINIDKLHFFGLHLEFETVVD